MSVACLGTEVEGFECLRGWVRDEAFLSTEREIRRLQALQASRVRAVEVSGSFVGDRFLNVTAWAQAVTNTSRAAAGYLVRVGRMLVLLPVLAAAVEAGSIGQEQLRLLTRLYANDRCRPLLAESDGLLTGFACSLTLRDFKVALSTVGRYADPDGANSDVELSRKNRKLRFAKLGTGFEITAEGDAVTGEVLDEIIAEQTKAEYLTDMEQRLAEHGDSANDHPLARSGTQRRFDAMVNLILKGAGVTRTPTWMPVVNVFCTEAVLQDAVREFLGGEPLDTSDAPANVPVSQRFRLCETATGAPASSRDLAIAALIGQIRRVVVDTAGRVIDLGRRRRLFTGAAREAVLLAGSQCCGPGCDNRSFNIHIDHLSAWAALNGATSPTNAGPMCAKHNQAKEQSRIRVKRDETGWHHYRPDNTEITPRTNP